MRFAFDDDQRLFERSAAAVLERWCPPDAVRAAWEAPAGGLDRAVWERLDELGVMGALTSECRGGLGLDERSLVLVLEAAGRHALPHPIVETAVVAAPMADVPSGSMVTSDLGGSSVPCAADADLILLRSPDRTRLHLVPRADTELTPIDSIDRGRRLATVSWRPCDDTVVADDPAVIELATQRGTFGTAAVLVGLGQAMVDMALSYVKGRTQFGVPVGSFQAVKHHLADAHMRLAFSRPAVYRASWSLATGAATRRRDVAMAKAMASDAARFAGRTSLQCHGAMGYTVEYDLHLFLKRTTALARAWGGAATHRATVADEIGLTDRSPSC